ncbi:MAG TPA: adenylate/guanylate cyclase domain-containing protein [Acidimicrobiia bacterium]|nr:adenylate/guanylate cyclase domain-containing protein [Acidimicrobiia bacterium]
MTCGSCGANAPEEARFCPSCGHTLVTRPDERRIATVLFADLVGFTTFSETADPEHVKNLVDRCFERLVADVTAFGGQVDKIVGDAIVALFGAPVAHEDDAERAVRAALQMQRTLATLRQDLRVSAEMRVGVNTGEVLVGAMRAAGEYTAMGDVVNTASRLQAAARPGQVIVGPLTHDATRRVVRYEPLGALVVKGREEPVEAWTAEEVIALPGQRPKQTRAALVGRDPEMSLLRRMFDAALNRQRAQLVLLFGEAGVGKSRLAVELAAMAYEERGATVLKAPCLPYGEANVWWPIAEAIRNTCGVDLDDSTNEARRKVEATVARVTSRDPNDSHVERISDGLLYLLGRFGERADVDPARARSEALWAVQAYLEALARERPLVLVLSDLHWGDEVVLELVDRLLAALRALPFMLLATARPDLEERWTPAPGRHNVAVLHLDPLDADATAALVEVHLKEHATPELVAEIRDRSGGNPLFIEELAALIRDSDGAIGADGARAFDSGDLPVTLRGLVAARLDALATVDRAVLEDCAVVGSSGPVEAVVGLGDAQSLSGAERALSALADRDLVVLEDGEFAFKSELIREVAYGTLTKAERARRHAALGGWLADRSRGDDEPVDPIAHHFGVAAELVSELGRVDGVPADLRARAVDALEHAAMRAEEVEAWPRAQRRYEQALAVLPEDGPVETRARLRLARAQARVERRDLAGVRAEINELLKAARVAGDRVAAARALTVLADCEQKEGNLIGSDATYEQAVAEWRALGDDRGVANALRGRGMTLMFRGELDDSEAAIQQALSTFRGIPERRGEAWALQNLAWIAFTRGRPDEAEERINQSAAVFAEIGDWGGLSWALGLLAWVRFNQGQLAEAEQLASDVLREGSESADRWANGMMGVLLANVAMWTGRPTVAIERSREARLLFQEIGDRWGEVQSIAPAARALGCLGRVDEAEALHAEVATFTDELGDPGLVAIPASVAGALAGHLGDGERARREFQTGIDAWTDEQSIANQESRVGMSRALLQLGNVAGALANLDTPRDDTDALLVASAGVEAMVLAAAGQPERAVALTDRANALPIGSYLDHLESWMARGLACAQLGEDACAREACATALALADGTESPLDQALARLAHSHTLTALDDPEAEAAGTEARARLDALGLPATGWETAFHLAATGGREVTPRDTTEVA